MTVEKQTGDQELACLRKMLQSAVPPVQDPEPQRDLWPLMLRRIEQVEGGAAMGAQWPIHVAWFDWALLGLAAATLVFVPRLIPALLYHL